MKGDKKVARWINANMLTRALLLKGKDKLRLATVINEIEIAPYVEAEALGPSGHWEEFDHRPNSSRFYCSRCGQVAYFVQRTRDRKWAKHCPYRFCPHCGIKMETKGE